MLVAPVLGAVTKSGTGTWGLRLGEVGLGDVRLGDVGLGDVGLGDAWRLGDVINKPDFCAEFVKYNFWWSRERCNMMISSVHGSAGYAYLPV